MSGLAQVRQPGTSAHCLLPFRSSGHLLSPSQDEKAPGLAWLTHPYPCLTNLLCPSNSPSRESPNTPYGSPLRPLPAVPPACRAPIPSVIRVTSSERPSQNSLAVMSPLPRCACARCCLIFLLFAHLPPTSRREAPPWDPSLGPVPGPCVLLAIVPTAPPAPADGRVTYACGTNKRFCESSQPHTAVI